MISKIKSIFKVGQNKPQKQEYKTPYDVPKEKQCTNCAYQNSDKCRGVNCFTGIMEKIRKDQI